MIYILSESIIYLYLCTIPINTEDYQLQTKLQPKLIPLAHKSWQVASACKKLVTKPEDLHETPKTHMVETASSESCPQHMHCHTHTQNEMFF